MGLVTGVPAVRGTEDVQSSVLIKIGDAGGDRTRGFVVGNFDFVTDEIARSVVVVINEIMVVVDRTADDVHIAVPVEIAGIDGRTAAAGRKSRPLIVVEFADLEVVQIKIVGAGIPDEENFILTDGQNIHVPVAVDVDGTEVVGRPVDIDPRLLETGGEVQIKTVQHL